MLDYVPCSEVKVGREYMYKPDDKNVARRVRITDGEYWGDYGVSNFWTWHYIKPDGTLYPKEYCGYGGCFRHAKPLRKR